MTREFRQKLLSAMLLSGSYFIAVCIGVFLDSLILANCWLICCIYGIELWKYEDNKDIRFQRKWYERNFVRQSGFTKAGSYYYHLVRIWK